MSTFKEWGQWADDKVKEVGDAIHTAGWYAKHYGVPLVAGYALRAAIGRVREHQLRGQIDHLLRTRAPPGADHSAVLPYHSPPAYNPDYWGPISEQIRRELAERKGEGFSYGHTKRRGHSKRFVLVNPPWEDDYYVESKPYYGNPPMSFEDWQKLATSRQETKGGSYLGEHRHRFGKTKHSSPAIIKETIETLERIPHSWGNPEDRRMYEWLEKARHKRFLTDVVGQPSRIRDTYVPSELYRPRPFWMRGFQPRSYWPRSQSHDFAVRSAPIRKRKKRK